MIAASLAIWLTATPVHSQQKQEFFPLEKVEPGLKGVGKTIFVGDKIEEFQVEILGVLKNAAAPKHDIILARLAGGPLEKTGVIAGMSGSPVYIDGKLLGAVALGFPFSKEPLAGITPISEMLDVVPAQAVTPASSPAKPLSTGRWVRIPGSAAELRLLPEGEFQLDDWAKSLATDGSSGDSNLTSLKLPLRFGGISGEAMQAFAGIFRGLGFEPAGGASLASSDNKVAASDPAPGSMISMVLVRGDLNVNVDCTVTYRDKDQLYACGHRFLMVGPAKIPFATARVITAVPNLASSFKLDVAGPVVGSITQDRYGAIYGVMGDKPRMIPVRIHVDSTLNRPSDINFEIAQHNFLSPLLLNIGVVSALLSTERAVGPATLELKGKIQLVNGQAIDLDDVVASDANTPGAAGISVAMPMGQLLNTSFPNLDIENVSVNLIATNEKRVAVIEQAWSSKSEVAPGDKIEVTVVLRTPSGETIVQKIPVEVPDNVNDRMLTLLVGSGSAVNQMQTRFSPASFVPRDLQQLIQAINKTRRNNRVYALLLAPQRSFVVQGDEYPSPPPSLIQTFLADPAVSGSVTGSGTSVIGDFETKPIPVSIRGQKTLMLKVVDTGE
jgi:hypothetical protein